MTADDNLYIFDFDSTFIQVETIDLLAKIALANDPNQKERLNMIELITTQAMEGRYSYSESLRERFLLLNLTQSHISQVLELLKQKITPSFLRNIDFFKKNANKIYIFTGSLLEIAWPLVQPFGLKREHVFGNRLLYDFEGNILGYDENNPLAQDQGKVKLATQLKLKGNMIIIGDGYNDYELKAAGLANTFIAFTENITRKPIVELADAVISELEGLFITCNIPYNYRTSGKKVLLLENIHPQVVAYFKNKGYDVQNLQHALSEAELQKHLPDVNIIGIRSKTQITANIIDNCPTLEAVGAFCIGTNQIDLKGCTKQGIAVFNAPFSNTRSVVELAMAEIIFLVRRAVSASNQLARGIWHKSSQGAHEVRGKTLGIIGYGNIGSQLSILAEAMGMHVQFYDIEDKLALGNAKRCATLDELLTHADVVTLHVDGRKENHHLITANTFAKMKDGAIFLNLSRDFTVDYDALTQALSSGKLSGTGVDVFPNEPHESKGEYKTALQQFDNVILTPHIGGSTEEAQQNIGEYVSKNLHAFSAHGSTLGSVNFPLLNLPTMNSHQRIIHIHENIPGMLAKINGLFAQYETNIEGQFLKTNDNVGYVITDVNRQLDDEMMKKLQAIPHTIKVKLLTSSVA